MTLHANTIADILLNADSDDLNRVLAVVRDRQNTLGRIVSVNLNAGDRVRFNDAARPTYMIGELATITKINGKSAVVELDSSIGRFHGNKLRVPYTLLEKV